MYRTYPAQFGPGLSMRQPDTRSQEQRIADEHYATKAAQRMSCEPVNPVGARNLRRHIIATTASSAAPKPIASWPVYLFCCLSLLTVGAVLIGH